MNPYAAYALAVMIGYLLGTSNMATYLAKAKGVDLRAGGSGNPGASNTVSLMGWKAGVLVGLHDIGKGFLAVMLCKLLFPACPYAGAAAGAACVLGHIYPFYLRFRGGKGFAAYYGMIWGLDWRAAFVIGVAIILVVLVTDYIVAGTMITVVGFPLWCVYRHDYVTAILVGLVSLLIIWKHRENLVRIAKGTEIKVRAAGKGDYRVK